MDVWDEIKHKRDCGVLHCGILEELSLSVSAVAASFKLHPDPNNYREITPTQARAIAVRILHRDLAYAQEIMTLASARRLAEAFMALFQEARFYTNGDFHLDSPSHAWNPATSATFDTGIIGIGAYRSGCLWVEDED